MTITRRDLLLGSAASAAAMRPYVTRAAVVPLPKDAEIVVVGAGAAGIAAARRLMTANRKVIVIEASDRIGGRCVTDVSKFEVPFDRGARWLYNPDVNPLARLARAAGVDLYPAPKGQRIRIGRRAARAGETEDFLTNLVRANRAIGDAVRGKSDLPASAVLPKEMNGWGDTIGFLLGAYNTGKDLKDVSAFDLAMAQPRDAASACRQGLGAFVAKLGEAAPVVLSTPVTRIAWSGRDIQIETPAGNLATRAVIVTASTNVLVSGKIKFVPDLPKRQFDAASRLPLGSYDHIALELPGNPLGLARDDVILEQSSDNPTGLLLANLGGSSLCQIDVGGSFGSELSAKGEAAMVAFAIEWLSKLFGADVARNVKATTATRWNDVPYVLGAMSTAMPGSAASRKVLMEPLGNLFFAGEAAHETQWGTVGGAWESGERAADAALRRLSGAKDNSVSETPPQRKSGRRVARETVAPVPSEARGLAWPRN